MDRYYEFAGVSYQLTSEAFDATWDDGVLTPYITEKKQCKKHLIISITDELSAPIGKLVFRDSHKHIYMTENGTYIRYEGVYCEELSKAYMRLERKEDVTEVQVKKASFGDKSILSAMELEHAIAENEGVIIHASFIKVKDKAIIFTAPSGIGKSTQAGLWCENRGAELLNGDRCILRLVDGEYYAFGVPYCGSSGVSKNVSLPLASVVYLSQASTTTLVELKGFVAFKRLWEGCSINTWNNEDMDGAIAFLTGLVENVPVVSLQCTPDISAVEALEAYLKEMNRFG